MRVFLVQAALVSCLATTATVTWNGIRAAEPETEDKTSEQKVDEGSEAKETETLEHVPTIVKIEYAVQQSSPPNLLITAYGRVPTGGWKQVQLLRRIYVTPPADGIWEYDLLALRPSGQVIQVQTPVRAKNVWKDYDRSIKGVRVYGIGRGAKELRF